jgi:predicted O-methyltransferase YrrM
MNDQKNLKFPQTVAKILSETTKIGFQMGANPLAASLFRTLAASKPAGEFLELGTGLENKHDLVLTKLNWASGIIVAAKP